MPHDFSKVASDITNRVYDVEHKSGAATAFEALQKEYLDFQSKHTAKENKEFAQAIASKLEDKHILEDMAVVWGSGNVTDGHLEKADLTKIASTGASLDAICAKKLSDRYDDLKQECKDDGPGFVNAESLTLNDMNRYLSIRERDSYPAPHPPCADPPSNPPQEQVQGPKQDTGTKPEGSTTPDGGATNQGDSNSSGATKGETGSNKDKKDSGGTSDNSGKGGKDTSSTSGGDDVGKSGGDCKSGGVETGRSGGDDTAKPDGDGTTASKPGKVHRQQQHGSDSSSHAHGHGKDSASKPEVVNQKKSG